MTDTKLTTMGRTNQWHAADDVFGYQVGDATGSMVNTVVTFFTLGQKDVLVIEERSGNTIIERVGPVRERHR